MEIRYNHIFFTLLFILFSVPTHAVDVDAKDYLPAPDGTTVFLFYGQYAQRNALYQGNQKVDGNVKLESMVGLFRFVQFTQFKGYVMEPQIIIPVGRLKASQDISDLGTSSGVLGDIMLANTILFFNDPLKGRVWGITPFLTIPTGNYHSEDALNMGENRYKLTLQTGFVNKFTEKLGTDLTADVTFYGKNDDYAEHQTLKQNPGYQLQADLFYQVHHDYDLRAGISYFNGGKVKLDDVTTDAAQQTKFWLGTQINFNPRSSIILTLGRDIKVENTFKENARFNLRYLYAF
ncbi:MULTISPECIES: transporter [unclassified Acinetobacter]|uniref:transporter n=1 Tax=unclassified Acinetobacter TaxID=196816 RepID=UPI00293512B8|nr:MULTISPECIES: transporter [unclassified Acinetobacter]WOE32039.1 transporter [Acinetobacter sp. SAAs470]WOE37508.1 transporter [Acinetobacter sp. SAAs474]